MTLNTTPELFESFLQDTWDALTQYDVALAALEREFTPDHLQRLGLLAHRIKGTAALYGFVQMSALAGLAENLLDLRPDLTGEARHGLTGFLERLGVCLRMALERISVREREGDLGLELAQLGGSALLRALLTNHPMAFARASGGLDSADGDLLTQLTAFRRAHAEIWVYFAPEAREHLDILRDGLAVPELDTAGLNALFRAAHTLKGSAYMVGFTPLGALGHALEDVLVAVREGSLTLSPQVSAGLGQGTELGEQMLRAAEGTVEGQAADLTGALVRVKRQLADLLGQEEQSVYASAALEARPAARLDPVIAPTAAVRVGTDRLDRLLNLVGEVSGSRSRLTHQLKQLADFGEALAVSHQRLARTVLEFEEQHLHPTLPLTASASQDAGTPIIGTTRPPSVSATVEALFADLEFDSYSDLNIVARAIGEMTADLGELRGQFEERLARLRSEDEALSKLTRTLRAEVTGARRVPFARAATRLKRWARTRDGSKPFTLEVSGEAVSVDTFVLEALVDPLLHLVNNALIHGLEASQQRTADGKSALGRIAVHAATRGNVLEVEVSDDGAGLDLAAVWARAQGLLPEATLAQLPEAERASLIFLPGLSTAAQVTSEAGRGVGMDVVASNLRRLGGEVGVHSEQGRGTTFTLRVPLTQQITETLLLQVANLTVGVPTTLVRSLQSVPEAQIVVSSGRETFVLEGESLRLLRLRPLWGYPAASQAPNLHIAVVQAGTRRIALVVDAFVGLEELSIQTSGSLLAGLEEWRGAAQVGSGLIALLLDPVGLERVANGVRPSHAALGWAASSTPQLQTRVLLVDDSTSVRRFVSKMLQEAGYQVVTASDGQEALELLRQDPTFSAVLTDLEMPRVSGYELIEEVRRSATPHLPVVVMTTRAGEKHRQLALDLGADAYFAKPIDRPRLLGRLAELTAP